MAETGSIARAEAVSSGQRLEYITLVLASAEAIAALATGVAACSIALLGFGFDSLIELASGAALLWRLHQDADLRKREKAERITLRIVGLCFLLLALYVVAESIRTLLLQERPERSLVGIFITAASFVAMVVLSRAKRDVARKLGSAAMNADASQAALCSYLSAITLGGLALNALFGWWWADPVAALAMTPIIAKEGYEALQGKSCGCEGGSCR